MKLFSTPNKRAKVTVVSEEAEHNPISQDAIVACMNDHSYTHPPDVSILENEKDKLITELQQKV